MGKTLLVVAGICWAALFINMIATFLRRFIAFRKLGVLLQWQAFAIYLLGLGGTGTILYSTLVSSPDREGLALIIAIIGIFTFVPLGACSFQFFAAVKKSRASAEP